MEFSPMHRLIVPGLLLTCCALLLSSCDAGSPSQESEVAGVISAKPLTHVALSSKSPAQLAAFRRNLAGSFVRHAPSGTLVSRTTALRGSLNQALIKSGGIPRAQVEDSLETIVSPRSKDCGGASCARVFGLSQEQVGKFLDESRDIIAKVTVRDNKDKIALRDLLLASLSRSEKLARADKPLAELLAALPQIQPSSTPRPDASRIAIDPEKILTESEIQQIKAYSHIFSTQFRAIEVNHVENLLKAGYSKEAIQDVKNRVGTINRALAKFPVAPGVTYRGIGNVSDASIEEFFRFKDSNKILTLGQRNLPALTSTSWNIQVAEAFAVSSNKTKHSIIFSINQRTGKTIESLSRYPAEEEVLIPSDAVFQVGKIAYINREKRILSIELIEVMRP